MIRTSPLYIWQGAIIMRSHKRSSSYGSLPYYIMEGGEHKNEVIETD